MVDKDYWYDWAKDVKYEKKARNKSKFMILGIESIWERYSSSAMTFEWFVIPIFFSHD